MRASGFGFFWWTVGLLMSLAGCVHHDQYNLDIPTATGHIILFVPDFQQSELVDTDESVVWPAWYHTITGAGSLQFDDQSLAILKPGALLNEKPGFLGFGKDLTGEFLAKLAKNLEGQASVKAVPYDWRAKLTSAVQTLATQIDGLRSRPGVKISLLCHGRGGLVCAYYLRYGYQRAPVARENWFGGQKIERVVFVSTPFLGSIAGWQAIEKGYPNLSQKVAGSFPSIYHFLPSPRSDFILSTLRQNISRTLYGSQNWLEFRWGILAASDSLSEEERRSRYASVQNGLEEALAFSDKLNAPSGPTARRKVPRLLNIHGGGIRTLSRLVWMHQQNIFSADAAQLSQDYPGNWDELLYEPGDGVISRESARLPKAFRLAFDVEDKELPLEHEAVLDAPDTVMAITNFLR